VSDTFDWEPEDSWHPDDHIALQIDNLLQRLELLDRHRGNGAGRWRWLIAELDNRLRPFWTDAVNGQLEQRDELRLHQLTEDLEFVRRRDDDGV